MAIKKDIKENMILLVEYVYLKKEENEEESRQVAMLIGTVKTNFIFEDDSIEYVELHDQVIIPTDPKMKVFTKTNLAKNVRGYREYIEALTNNLAKMITKIMAEKNINGKEMLVKEIQILKP